jgi:hypothetical protein
MAVRDVGDGFEVEYLARDADGTLVDATVALTVTDPAGGTDTPGVSHPAAGTYRYVINLASAGEWQWHWSITGAVEDEAYGSVLAVPVAPPAYSNPERLKLWMAGRAAGSTTTLAMDASRDELLQAALYAASRGIDARTGRRFYRDATASARVFNPRGRTVPTRDGELLLVDDLATDEDLIVEVGTAGGTTWTQLDATAYEAGPDNALARLQPLTYLLRINGCWATTPTTRVRITPRSWGWPAEPAEVEQATLIQASRLYKRKDSPEGVLGNAEWGTVRLSRVDPDVEALISHLILPGFA